MRASTIVAVAAVLLACGGNSSGKCAEADRVLWSGEDEYCAGKADVCYHCDCWNKTLLYVPGATACTNLAIKTGTKDAECYGETLAVAENCLANEASCKQSGANIAQQLCEDYPK